MGLASLRRLPRGLTTQLAFDQLGTPLVDVTFCVVDLETTGGSPQSGAHITEIGAVKVHGGEVVGEFQTLVNPLEPVPAFITLLTGITNQMVVGAPTIAAALPSFLEFARGSVLVAHNAGFDLGFLKHNAQTLDLTWPKFRVIDTAALSRQVLHRDEVHNHKLATLAHHFNSPTTPNHRALTDAQATVTVLHGLIERVGSLGVQTLEELASFSRTVSSAQRRKRNLAADLPHAPGVYLFRDQQGKVLYVGTSKDIRSRVRQYFTAAETRSRIGEMVGLADLVEPLVCATALEAQVRELRLIHHHQPPYNKRSKFPQRATYLVLTDEPWPRLSIVRKPPPGRPSLGPFPSRRVAEEVQRALVESIQLRQCTQRLPKQPTGTACVLAELDKCGAPCTGAADPERYELNVKSMAAALTGQLGSVADPLQEVMLAYAEQERYEAASVVRDRLHNLVRLATRSVRMRTFAACAEIVAIRRNEDRWEVHVFRHGRLVGAGVIPPRAEAAEFVAQVVAASETVTASGEYGAAAPEEVTTCLAWLEQPGVRLVAIDGEWSSPVDSPARWLAKLTTSSLDARAHALARLSP